MKVYFSPDHRLHDPSQEFESSRFQVPFEHAGRAEMIHSVLDADDGFEIVRPTPHGIGPISAVHDSGLVDFLASAWDRYQEVHPDTDDVVADMFSIAALREGMGPAPRVRAIDLELGRWCFETTTPITNGTYDAARSAVDVALGAADAVLDGELIAYGLCRPPGHHAPRAAYGGYCFFNNAAIVAHDIVERTGSKVTVLDVDYHHGNGTQQIFYDRDDVQFVSLHGDPHRAYPHFAGFASETGVGRGAGATHNVSLPVGACDDLYITRLGHALERIAAFDPGVVVVSLGVDTHHADPISDLELTADGLARCGALVANLGVPLVVLQEGGYADERLGQNVRRWLVGAQESR
ncbi:histone deacetylase family protein [Ilumatobacter sp.]|uniref:histone deacetylase family protein n=1 Tax=Ilumatobacter sp. TaxID=1967498 RepID=UPI003B515A36